VSHKLMRLMVPFALVLAFLTSALLPGSVYTVALVIQLAFYGLSLLAVARMKGPLARAADAAFTFVVLNGAAVVAFANFVTRRKTAWVR